MAEFALIDGQRWTKIAGNVSGDGAVVQVAGSANTKGSWVQLDASTARTYHGVLIGYRIAATTRWALMDIGIGAAGSEVVLIPNLAAGVAAGDGSINPYFFPITIPAGSRVAARGQSSTASTFLTVTVLGLSQGMAPSSPLQKVTAYGPNTSTSAGPVIDPGGTVDTKGAWVELTASTTSPIHALVASLATNRAMGTSASFCDIGIGAAGSEVVLIPDIPIYVGPSGDVLIPGTTPPMPVRIPAGTRIAMRYQSNNNTVGAREVNGAVYGIG